MRIEEVLARRSDLSTFLVHLTRTAGGTTARDRVSAMIRERRLLATTPFGSAKTKLVARGNSTTSQRCVCFTETPLEHVNLLAQTIDGRECQFEPYGIGITKKQARRGGVNPIWYLDITPGHDWLTRPLEQLIDAAIATDNFAAQPIAKLAPLIEQMGSGEGAGGPYRKEFWWEREWRFVGDFQIPDSFLILCPEAEIPAFRAVVGELDEPKPTVAFLDPRWSLEQIIAKLAGFPNDDVGPM